MVDTWIGKIEVRSSNLGQILFFIHSSRYKIAKKNTTFVTCLIGVVIKKSIQLTSSTIIIIRSKSVLWFIYSVCGAFCVIKSPNLFLRMILCLEYLSSGEKRAERGRETIVHTGMHTCTTHVHTIHTTHTHALPGWAEDVGLPVAEDFFCNKKNPSVNV